MRAILSTLKFSSRVAMTAFSAVWLVLTVGLAGRDARGQTAPKVVMSQSTVLAHFASGGAFSGYNPAGGSIGIDQNGDVIVGNTYGGDLYLFNGQTGVATTLGSTQGQVGSTLVDSNNNLYVAYLFPGSGPAVAKIPYANGTYTLLTGTVPACSSTTTGECDLTPVLKTSANGYFGVLSMAFDAAGDFYFATVDQNADPNAIFECNVACLAGTGTAVQLFQEPTGTTSQTEVGSMAVDSYGNLFFTDSTFLSSGTEESLSSTLKELPVATTATGYAATPTTLYTFTTASPGSYDDELDGLAIRSDGTILFAMQNEGVFAFPAVAGVVQTGQLYTVTTQGAKLLGFDGNGNLDEVGYVSSGDALTRTSIGSVVAPSATVGGAPTTASFLTVVNDGSCNSTGVSFAATESGAATTEFTAATSGSCAGGYLATSSSFPATLTFTPATGGTRTAILTATDTYGSSGTATASGTGISTTTDTPTFSPMPGTFTSTQTVMISDGTMGAAIYYTTDGTPPSTSSTLYTAPVTVASTETIKAIATYSGLTNSAVATGLYTIEPPAATPTILQGTGVYVGTQSVTIMDSTMGASIYYTTNNTTPSASSTLYMGAFAVSSSETIQAIAIAPNYANSAVATATYTITTAPSVGPVPVVVSQTSQLGVFANGGTIAAGNYAGADMVINQQGLVIATEPNGGDVVAFNAVTGATTKLLTGWSNIGPVAVDPNNNLWVANIYGGIIKIPYVSGAYVAAAAPTGATPACTGSDTVECTPGNLTNASNGYYIQIRSMTFDSKGNLYYGYGAVGNGATAPAVGIYECIAACLATGTPAAIPIYGETGGPATNGAAYLTGAMSVDASGNLFFTDSDYYYDSSYTPYSYVSNLKELVYTSGTGFASTAITLETYTPATVSGDDNELAGVSVANGVVYFSTLYDGIFALPDAAGVVNTANVYAINTSQGGKALVTDGAGNFYVDTYSNSAGGDVLQKISSGTLTVPAATIGGAPATNASVSTVLNDAACGGASAATFASSSAQFAAATTGGCSSTLYGGASLPTTVTFTPSASGPQTATLTATDNLGNSGMATVTAVGQTATVTSQTIMFPAPTSPVSYGVAPITLSASASSGLAVSFSVTSGPGTISGNTLTVTGVGTIVVAANQAGNTTYTAAPTVSQSIVVNPAAQTITFTAPASPVQYGVAPITLSASASSGLAVTFSVTSGPGTVSGNMLTVTGVGTIVVAANQAGNTDYAAATAVSQSIVVNGESQTITFTAPTTPVTYGVAPITLSASASSGLAVTFSVTSGPGMLSGNTLTVTGAGTIVVAANQAGNASYAAAAAVSQSIVVNPAQQTITFTAPMSPVTYGVGPITLSASASSGLAVAFSVTSGPGTVSGNTLTVTGVGTIVVAANQAGNTNYAAAAAVSQSVVVNPVGVVATPTFSPAAGTFTSVKSVAIADTTAGTTIYYTTNGTTPTTASAQYSGTAISVGVTETIEAIAVATGYTNSAVATAAYTINLPPPNFTIAANESTVQVTYGYTTPVTLTLTSTQGYTGNVSLACSGLPTGASCSFSPATVVLAANGSVTATVNVTAPTTSARLERKSNPMLPGGAAFAAALCVIGLRKRRRLQVVLMLLAGVAGMGMLSGCGTSQAPLPPIVTQTVMVTATSGSLTNTVTFSLVEE